MASATPGVKSTPDGWLNRYLHAREHQAATPFRAVALAPQLPRSLQGNAPALAIGQIDRFGIRAGQNSDLSCAEQGGKIAVHVQFLYSPSLSGMANGCWLFPFG